MTDITYYWDPQERAYVVVDGDLRVARFVTLCAAEEFVLAQADESEASS